MVSELILAWYNNELHAWVPVGRLAYQEDKYYFRYTCGVNSLNSKYHFRPLPGLEEFNTCYESDDIFPLFKNRLLQKNRPEYGDYLNWLNIAENAYSPMEELARTGGTRSTDHLRLFPVPLKREGQYVVSFFSYGIRHLPGSVQARLEAMVPGDRLLLMKDFQNTFDSHALLMRSEDPPEVVGYVPRFFAEDLESLVEKNGGENVVVTVEKVNPASPSQYKLLCQCKTPWPEGFVPFESEAFQVVS
ncbi:HIRAN domain-containing protein [Desulfoluna spongiiphila]|uniref:HIRAN domain-containing protein n=1 Tax=Desulfoluna spongiiphila TaxID=419481 RepID=UPI00125650F9|nr:HIRAN domain-containing protein [Desulfoluna spongiiphila]VVS93061.1 hiran domain [Desulfoluna spongiiphila]